MRIGVVLLLGVACANSSSSSGAPSDGSPAALADASSSSRPDSTQLADVDPCLERLTGGGHDRPLGVHDGKIYWSRDRNLFRSSAQSQSPEEEVDHLPGDGAGLSSHVDGNEIWLAVEYLSGVTRLMAKHLAPLDTFAYGPDPLGTTEFVVVGGEAYYLPASDSDHRFLSRRRRDGTSELIDAMPQVSARTEASGIATDGTWLFWGGEVLQDGAVMPILRRVPVASPALSAPQPADGSNDIALLPADHEVPTLLRVTGNRIIADLVPFSAARAAIVSYPIDGKGPPLTIASDLFGVAFTTDAGYVYWLQYLDPDRARAEIRVALATGANSERVHGDLRNPWTIQYREGALYVGGADGFIRVDPTCRDGKPR